MLPLSKIITAEKLLDLDRKKLVILDVRSPSEFQEDHVLGALNFPVLDDSERAIVGTRYKQNSFEARQMGAKIISSNISKILSKIESIPPVSENPKEIIFIIYCWRGGMRSRSLFTVMDMIGYKSFLLDKGYKSYRQTVNHFFYSARLPKIINLYGPSGTGKTELLAIFKKNNIPIINLENLANHKGSILGGFEADQPSQKYFESLLFEEIRKFQDAKFIVLEGESRKIGKLSLPKILYDSMISGENVWVEIPRNIRAVRLAEEYKDNSNLIIERLNYIKKTLGGESYEEVSNLIFSNKRVEAAEILLQKYYDVFYLKSSPEKGNRKYCKIFKENSFEELADSVLSFFQEKR